MIDYTQHNLWPTPVYQSRIELQDKWLEFSKTCEYERMETDNGDISKDRYILNSMDLKNDIQDHVNNYVRDWLRIDKKAEFYFTNSWMVRHNKKDWSGMHFHTNSLVSGVYYIDIPEDSPKGIPITYVPARNTIMMSLALAWAENLNCRNIFI